MKIIQIGSGYRNFMMEQIMERVTYHAEQRMNQRGIQAQMVDMVLEYGEFDHRNRCILGKKDAARTLRELQKKEQALKKILDKGGVVVVAEEDSVITTYNYQGRQH